jgi:hypothetical protein
MTFHAVVFRVPFVTVLIVSVLKGFVTCDGVSGVVVPASFDYVSAAAGGLVTGVGGGCKLSVSAAG